MQPFVIEFSKQKYIVLHMVVDEKHKPWYLMVNTDTRRMLFSSEDMIKNATYVGLCGN